mmetsp:Transcript_33688/g.88241  ORF Transcript_33688/g.88241 Transcript_33688/m.88241 type:complete len:222 (+) Transcript_33688:263-928(+)
MDFEQYSFLLSSSACSSARSFTMLSIIEMIFAKLKSRPCRAMVRKSSCALSVGALPARDLSTSARARFRSAMPLASICTKLGDGRVFLNSSRASSSDKILMVSWMATSSSARSFLRSSHSPVFESQSFWICSANLRSSARLPCVAWRSCFMLTTPTCSSPMREVFDSISAVRTLTCFDLAVVSSSKVATAFASASWTSLRLEAKLSSICFNMPVTSPLFGT